MRSGGTIPTQRRPSQHVETVIVGGGQAGLVMSYLLSQCGREHVVLERAQPAHAWRTRWDSFALNTVSGRSLNLPGLPYSGSDPEGFALREEVIAYFDAYLAVVNPPVRSGVTVTAVVPAERGRFLVETDHGRLLADNVVIATGRNHTPHLPDLALAMPPDIVQLHTHDYRRPGQLPAGNVLVVGSGQSSCQIVEELQAAGHRVYLSVGSTLRSPMRYRGRTMAAWVRELSDDWQHLVYSTQITGRDGGRSLNMHAFARDGMVLLGRLAGIDGRVLHATPDLYEHLAAADAHDALARRVVDAYIDTHGLDYPEEPPPPALRDGFDQPLRTELGLDEEGITSVIWGTGYRFDLSWVQFPILDRGGEPLQTRGVTDVPGVYVPGFSLLRRPRSSFLAFVGADAASIVDDLTGRNGGSAVPTRVG
jgi:putative flavoprotein involved in K+ transport